MRNTFHHLRSRYAQIAEEAQRKIRLRVENYASPTRKHYVISFFITAFLTSPILVLLMLTIKSDNKGLPFSYSHYCLIILLYHALFILTFILPDGLFRTIRDVQMVKHQVLDMPVILNEDDPFRGCQDTGLIPALGCHLYRLISYVLFFILAVVLPPYILDIQAYRFPLGTMAFSFVCVAHFNYILSFWFIEPYTNPKRCFNP